MFVIFVFALIRVCLDINMGESDKGKAVINMFDDREWNKVFITDEIMDEIHDKYKGNMNITMN